VSLYPPSAVSPRDPVVVCSPDEEYALGLAVAIHSVLENLDPARRLRLFLLDGGVSRPTRRLLLRSWDPTRVAITWVEPDLERIRAIAVETYPSPSVYLRLFAPELLPASVDKVIYLDSDLVVLADLSELWDREFEGNLLLAVQDTGLPFIDAERALPNYAACASFLWGSRPIGNYDAHGIDSKSKYFNSGVLVIDLEGWRREGISEHFLACLHENREYAKLPDQYVLNTVLAGRWGELDLRWNVAPAIFHYPSAAQSPFGEAEYERAIADPCIVHYVGVQKPWRRDWQPAWQEHFQRYLEGTGWPRWRRLRWTVWPWARDRALKRAGRVAKRGRRTAKSVARAGRRLRGWASARIRPG
jgi:lipopolysaccharide biosynthesis glycosyltransferase